MNHFTFGQNIGVLFFTFLFGNASAQENPKNIFYVESHAAVQPSFGPSLSQAEIAGGLDSLSFDKKKHLAPGFKTSTAAEFAAGICRNKFQCQTVLGYFKQDIGLLEKLSQQGEAFITADLFSIKVSTLFQLTDAEKREANGFYAGLFIGSVFPISNNLNDNVKINYGINAIRPSAEFYWGLDFNYILSFGKKGWYVITGVSTTMPGLLGGIGKIEMETNSSYSIIRDNIKMYSIRGFIGIGLNLKCKGDQK